MSDEILEKILDFFKKHLKYEDREILKEYIKQHEKYGTFDYAVDTDGEIVAVVRWNFKDGVGNILDFAVKDVHRNKGVGKDFIKRALKKFPNAKKIIFQRGMRGDYRVKSLSIDKVLAKNIL
jgi:predicted GNAT family acetyltransferase